MMLAKILNRKFLAGRMAGFFTLVYMLGLACLGWGVNDLAGFLSNPVRISFALIAVTQALIHVWVALRLPSRPLEREPSEDLEHWHYSLTELIAILAAFGDRRNILTWAENPSLRWAGIGIFILGSIYAIWVNLTWVNHLRQTDEHTYDDPVLLSAGPFQWTRYPILLILLLYSLGFVFLFRSRVSLFLIIPLLYIIVRRANLWEKMYSKRYKNVWALRCSTSKKIIPFLY